MKKKRNVGIRFDFVDDEKFTQRIVGSIRKDVCAAPIQRPHHKVAKFFISPVIDNNENTQQWSIKCPVNYFFYVKCTLFFGCLCIGASEDRKRETQTTNCMHPNVCECVSCNVYLINFALSKWFFFTPLIHWFRMLFSRRNCISLRFQWRCPIAKLQIKRAIFLSVLACSRVRFPEN